MNSQLRHGRPRNVPPEPGDGPQYHTASSRTSIVQPNEVHLRIVPYNMPRITFRQAMQFWWRDLWNQQARPRVEGDHGLDQVLSSPLQIWWALNVCPRLTPVRIFWFLLGNVSFVFARGAFSYTQFYKSTIGGRGSVVGLAVLSFLVTIHFLVLALILLCGICDSACDRYRHHFLMKSVGDFLVMFGACLLLLIIGHNPTIPSELVPAMAPSDDIRFSEIAGVVTCALLSLDALCIINLLGPGHHYYIFEVTTMFTMHWSLELLNRRPYPGAFAASFIFVIIVFKNFVWRHAVNEQAPPNQQQTLPLVPLDNIP
ncbi:hypothetical protein CJ030_MR2G025507 [Morella rubra]|uniref:Uncharacterized protein n=1 Tax=Morella rubra TaxID=262757 RepID=A0A6A1WAW4_9ROSI|nr:hypothetical protein CJ030_MR2G025507 [Morella rubra]